MARKVAVRPSPGKGGVKHDIKKPIVKKKVEKQKLNIIERMVRSSPRTSARKALSEISNELSTPVKKETIKNELKVESPDEENKLNVKQDPMFDGLCEYEMIRMRNIMERQALFQSLDMEDAKSELTPSRPKHVPSSRGLASVKKVTEVLPPRKSARLAGGLVPDIDRFVPLVEEPEEDNIASLEELSIKDAFVRAEDEDFVIKTKKLLFDLKFEPKTRHDSTFTPSPSFSDLDWSLSQLTITDDLVAKVVPDRIFSVSLHPGDTRLVCAVAGKVGHVGLWDIMNRDDRFSNGVHLYQPHTRPVNTMNWDQADTSRLVTTSYDGTSRVLDCGLGQWRMLYGEKQYLENGGWTSCHAQQSPNTWLISQGNTGSVVLVDTRVGWELPSTTMKCFERLNPKSLSVHPKQPNVYLTGTNKGGCFIFDIRMARDSSLMTPVSELSGHSRSLSSCVFSRDTGDQVATLASDDKLRLYDTSYLDTPVISPQCAVRHNNQTGRWLTPLRLTWHPARPGVLVCGSMMRPRQIEVWDTEGGDLRPAAQLTGEALGSVTSIVDIHPTRDVIVGGNSSGRCHVFMPAE